MFGPSLASQIGNVVKIQLKFSSKVKGNEINIKCKWDGTQNKNDIKSGKCE